MHEAAAMFVPFRLSPGEDLRRSVERAFAETGAGAGFVAACVGSLVEASLRLADQDGAHVVPGPLEIVSLSGTLSPDGPHLHLAVADRKGRVTGAHLLIGARIRTTAEIVLGLIEGTAFSREVDPATGWRELRISTNT